MTKRKWEREKDIMTWNFGDASCFGSSAFYCRPSQYSCETWCGWRWMFIASNGRQIGLCTESASDEHAADNGLQCCPCSLRKADYTWILWSLAVCRACAMCCWRLSASCTPIPCGSWAHWFRYRLPPPVIMISVRLLQVTPKSPFCS